MRTKGKQGKSIMIFTKAFQMFWEIYEDDHYINFKICLLNWFDFACENSSEIEILKSALSVSDSLPNLNFDQL